MDRSVSIEWPLSALVMNEIDEIDDNSLYLSLASALFCWGADMVPSTVADTRVVSQRNDRDVHEKPYST